MLHPSPIGHELWIAAKRMWLLTKTAQISFFCKVSFKGWERNSDIWTELELEKLLLPIKGQKLAWFGYLIRMCPESLPLEETIELEPNVGNWYIQFGQPDRMLMLKTGVSRKPSLTNTPLSWISSRDVQPPFIQFWTSSDHYVLIAILGLVYYFWSSNILLLCIPNTEPHSKHNTWVTNHNIIFQTS